MSSAKTQHTWTTGLKFYSEQNAGRATRLGVFENEGNIVNDYWIEDGLPLLGLSVDPKSEFPTVEIMLGSYTYFARSAYSLVIHYSLDGKEDGIDIKGNDGKTTVLRFEDKF